MTQKKQKYLFFNKRKEIKKYIDNHDILYHYDPWQYTSRVWRRYLYEPQPQHKKDFIKYMKKEYIHQKNHIIDKLYGFYGKYEGIQAFTVKIPSYKETTTDKHLDKIRQFTFKHGYDEYTYTMSPFLLRTHDRHYLQAAYSFQEVNLPYPTGV